MNSDLSNSHNYYRRNLRSMRSRSATVAAAAIAAAILSSPSPPWTSCVCMAVSVDSDDVANANDQLLHDMHLKEDVNSTDDSMPIEPASSSEKMIQDRIDTFDQRKNNETNISINDPSLENETTIMESDKGDSEYFGRQDDIDDVTSTGGDGSTVDNQLQSPRQESHGNETDKNEQKSDYDKSQHEIDEDVVGPGNDDIASDGESTAGEAAYTSIDSDQDDHVRTVDSTSEGAPKGEETLIDDDSSIDNARHGANQKDGSTGSTSNDDYLDLDEEGTSEASNDIDKAKLVPEGVDDTGSSINTTIEDNRIDASVEDIMKAYKELLSEEETITTDSVASDSSMLNASQNTAENDKILSPELNEISNEDNDAEASSKEKPPPKGSLASFFAQVSEKEKGGSNLPKSASGKNAADNKSNGNASASFEQRALLAEEMHMFENIRQQQLMKPLGKELKDPRQSDTPSEPQKKLEDYPPKEYGGTWGVNLKRHRPADLDLLFLVFQDQVDKLLGRKHYEYQEALFPLGINTDLEEDDELDSQEEFGQQMMVNVGIEFPSTSEGIQAEPAKNSVNSDFVEGLDDIDKFFEGVDPPDELDIGASGASMQEVLMGKGGEILFKRIGLLFRLVRSGIASAWNRLSTLLHRFNDDGEFVVTKENMEDTAKGLWKATVATFQRVVDFIDELIDGDDLGDEDLVDLNSEFEKMGLRDISLGSAGPNRPPPFNNLNDGSVDSSRPGMRLADAKEEE